MYVKGADNVIKDRLDMSIPQPFLENADKKLTEFSVVGLRTLLIGMKIMSQFEIDAFTSRFNELANSQNRMEDLGKINLIIPDERKKTKENNRRFLMIKLFLSTTSITKKNNYRMKSREDSF